MNAYEVKKLEALEEHLKYKVSFEEEQELKLLDMRVCSKLQQLHFMKEHKTSANLKDSEIGEVTPDISEKSTNKKQNQLLEQAVKDGLTPDEQMQRAKLQLRQMQFEVMRSAL